MSGATLGGIAGAAIGFMFGGPAGAQWGAMIGSTVGGYVDPDVIKGPQLGDIPVQTSQEGVPRPIVFGSPPPFPGNIIQIGPKVFTTKKERQGKGGPVVESQEVYQTYAIRISEGEATVITVWRDGKVVFDRSGKFPVDADGQAFQSRSRFYTGDELQLPDPALEANVTTGMQPAYRGTAYMVVAADNLTNTGGRIPNYEFRMASVATVTEECQDEEGLLWWYPLDDCVPGGVARELVGGYNGVYSDTGVGGGGALSIYGTGSMVTSDYGGGMYTASGVTPVLPRTATLTFWFQPLPGPNTENEGGSTDKHLVTLDDGSFEASGSFGSKLDQPNTPADEKDRYQQFYYKHSLGFTQRIEDTSPVVNGRSYFAAIVTEENGNGSSVDFRAYRDGRLIAEQLDVPQPFQGEFLLVGGGATPPGEGAHPLYSSFYQFFGAIADVKAYGRALSADEIFEKWMSIDGDFWENPDAPGTWTSANGQLITFCNERAELGTVSLAEVELEIARLAGVQPSQFNVTADEEVPVDGFLIGKLMPAADALRSLGGAYLREYPEYDLQIVSTPLGGDTVATLTEDNCIDSELDEQTRSQQLDLPRKINLFFYDPDAGAIVPVPATRTSINVTAEGILPVQLPMTLNRDHAKQIAEIMLKVMWEEQTGNRLIRTLPLYEHAYLTNSDPIDFEGQRWRIVKTIAREGQLQIEAVRDRKRNWLSNATANILEPPQTPVSNIKGPSVFVAMNLPALRTEDVGHSGVYGAVTGLTTGWPGAYIYATLDPDANTWTRLITMQSPATMGRLYTDLSSAEDSNGYLIDPMDVLLYNNATLDSATQAQLDAGANGFAIITDGVADLGQFGTAIPDSGGNYELTDVVLGQLTTTATDHNEGDKFVKVDNNLYFIDLPAEWAGHTVYFKPVTIGTPIENAPIYSLLFELRVQVVDGGEVT